MEAEQALQLDYIIPTPLAMHSGGGTWGNALEDLSALLDLDPHPQCITFTFYRPFYDSIFYFLTFYQVCVWPQAPFFRAISSKNSQQMILTLFTKSVCGRRRLFFRACLSKNRQQHFFVGLFCTQNRGGAWGPPPLNTGGIMRFKELLEAW